MRDGECGGQGAVPGGAEAGGDHLPALHQDRGPPPGHHQAGRRGVPGSPHRSQIQRDNVSGGPGEHIMMMSFVGGQTKGHSRGI